MTGCEMLLLKIFHFIMFSDDHLAALFTDSWWVEVGHRNIYRATVKIFDAIFKVPWICSKSDSTRQVQLRCMEHDLVMLSTVDINLWLLIMWTKSYNQCIADTCSLGPNSSWIVKRIQEVTSSLVHVVVSASLRPGPTFLTWRMQWGASSSKKPSLVITILVTYNLVFNTASLSGKGC